MHADKDAAGHTFSLENEDHTLANTLRYMLNGSLQVEFAGYSIPHPSENMVNIRVQTTGEKSAREVFRESLGQLAEQTEHIKSTFQQAVAEFKAKQGSEPMQEDSD
uniref:DNA-directed RNA polymerase RBP11-like dimerisation domain-containing protein n=1 Tax=Tetraselmis chuii TaxID=63592 RepID=A0A6U1EKQ2_9CHLO|mmetsp:Transcript_17001/g.30371  ORF Transcript_17001/g.30371 Transcript_17001/m.30371 type:complete len:106 (+) Transcript_17001:341-658(+)|eukprot:CAMPEP_0177774532 /NCGR_PEP_ID=MMETSP0491_2-20121128/13560_1 /TAXON_ID=63592 /ORGANISM="Tetraselmis chuii, Strain PLY429" /LENGTH=105 /DNA_ID=CAMNT_0019292923 /DNA_START=252 /DNA_END=569 /DNA_ORIENTATION=+